VSSWRFRRPTLSYTTVCFDRALSQCDNWWRCLRCHGGHHLWFPKAFGFTLNERLGKAVFWCWFIGFYLAFMPLYALGLMGATRRMQHYSNTHWQPLMLVALGGRCTDPLRYRTDRRAARREHSPARTQSRCDGGSVERSHARMVDPVPAAGVELLASAASGSRGCVLGHEATARDCAGSQPQADL